jgi:hypothetical protein
MHSSNTIGVPILRVVVDDLAVAVIGSVNHFILVDFAQPHVVALGICVKDIHGDVRSAHLSNNGSKCAVSHIYCAVLLGGITNKRFSSLESMNVVFEDSGNFVLVEIGHPVEEGVQISFWTSIKGFANRVDWNVVADELELIPIVFE